MRDLDEEESLAAEGDSVNDTAEQAGNGTPSEPVSKQTKANLDLEGNTLDLEDNTERIDSQSVEAAVSAPESPADHSSSAQDSSTAEATSAEHHSEASPSSTELPAASPADAEAPAAAESPAPQPVDSVLDLNEEVASKTAGAEPAEEVDASEATPQIDDAQIAEIVEPDPLAILELQLQESQAAAQEFRDQLYRKAAELENTRRRLSKQLRDAKKYAGDSVLREFLPVNDDLERAIEHASTSAAEEGGEKNAQVSSFIDGMTLVLRKFTATLERFGVKGFQSIGEPFSPQLHEAIQQITTTEIEPGHVAAEFLRGYMMQDRLLRPALVAVAAPPAEAAPSTEPPEEGEVIDVEAEQPAAEAQADSASGTESGATADDEPAAPAAEPSSEGTGEDSGAQPAQGSTTDASEEQVEAEDDSASGSAEAASVEKADQT